MEHDVIAVALRVLNAITRGHTPKKQDRDTLKSLVADTDQELPLGDIAQLILNHELVKQNSAMARQVMKLA